MTAEQWIEHDLKIIEEKLERVFGKEYRCPIDFPVFAGTISYVPSLTLPQVQVPELDFQSITVTWTDWENHRQRVLDRFRQAFVCAYQNYNKGET